MYTIQTLEIQLQEVLHIDKNIGHTVGGTECRTFEIFLFSYPYLT